MIEINIIAALLRDVHNAHGLVFNTSALRKTLDKIKHRVEHEGLSFLTKTMPRLGKAFDKAIANNTPLNSTSLGYDTLPGSELPRFLGEFFSRVLKQDGTLLSEPCAQSVEVIRQILYPFYKYKLPYTDEQEQQVVRQFERTEEDLRSVQVRLESIENYLEHQGAESRRTPEMVSSDPVALAREAKILLSRLLSSFDPLDVKPRHGPGVVSTREQLQEKYQWTNVSRFITDMYPFDAYFCASSGHVCDSYQSFTRLTQESRSARVILVPKDSRGPRLISCEPVDYQWIQQGLGRGLVSHVERHYLTKDNVHFTHQYPNRIGALWGSQTGRYSTLDLNEASDRVSTALVRLLWPSHVYTYLSACRSLSTELPDGRVIMLRKFAPMGSALCFPVLALTVWAILTAGAPDGYTKDRILVYGDDVVVPTAHAENAMKQLEWFGLKINRDKSCTSGLFRESCGQDAFQGKSVTPVRFRTVWSSTPSPDAYSSWIAYANQLWDKRYYRAYDLIVSELLSIYGPIPDQSMNLSCPSLRSVPECGKKLRRRVNSSLQKLEYRVWDITSPSVTRTMDGWSMLLRFFTESGEQPPVPSSEALHYKTEPLIEVTPSLSVSRYTKRRTSMLVRRWR